MAPHKSKARPARPEALVGRAEHDAPGKHSPVTSRARDTVSLVEEAERRTRELSALLEVSRVVASSLDLSEVLGAILDQLGSIVEHTGSSVLILKDSELEFVDQRSIAGYRTHIGARLPLGEPPTALWEALRSGETVIIDDVRSDEPMAADYRWIVTAGGVSELPPLQVLRSWMGVPLILKRQIIGMLTISHVVPARFNAADARIARAFADHAALAIENARLYEEMRSSARRFEALSRADSELFRSLDLDTVLQAFVDVTVDVLGVDKSIVTTWDVDARVMTLRAWRNLSEPTLEYIRELFSRRTQSLDVPRIIVTEDPSRAEPHLVPIIEAEGIRSMIEVPVVSRDGRPLGFFSVTYCTEHHFDEAEQDLLTALAERASVAISNAELFERAQQAASLEERQRLARELHDSVSQALYGIALGARTARTLLDRDPPAAVEPVDYVLNLAEVGLAEMRALIFELRPESLENEGLVASVRKQVEAVQARHGMQVDFQPCAEPDLPLPVKEAAYRIAQESLHNVVKHSRATEVRVALTSTTAGLQLEVADNGTGFDTAGDFPGHLGLRSMTERAEKSGGRLEISSQPGAGTRVTATFAVR
jgi:signal transduction histidine kinase